MPWEEKRKETMRKEFVERVLSHEKSKSALCREYGISRPTGDKWIKRYLAEESLEDQSRAPKKSGNKTDVKMEQFIVNYRQKYPAIGAVKIHRMLENEGYTNLPCSATINNIFKRNGLISEDASRAATPYIRFEKDAPNEMWQADFKGHFPLGNGVRCHPLDIIDDYSRFNLCCTPVYSESYAEVKPILERVFKEYGLPKVFLCDNGNPWGVQMGPGFTQFEVWLMDLGILVVHGSIRHPQTQGKEERFNGTLNREFLKYNTFTDEIEAGRKLADYREFYNNKRPHHALELAVPASRYSTSPRKYPDRISEWEYPPDHVLRRVNHKGYINLHGRSYLLSESFSGRQLAIRESGSGSSRVNLYYRQFRIAQVDLAEQKFLFKRAYLAVDDPRFSPDLNPLLGSGAAGK